MLSCKTSRACAKMCGYLAERHSSELLKLCQLPAQRKKNYSDVVLQLWFNFARPARPAHKWCKPIRPLLFISPLRAISLSKLGKKSTIFFIFLITPHWLHTLSLPIRHFHYIHKILKRDRKKRRREKTISSGCLFSGNTFFVFSWTANLWSTCQCGSLCRLRENCL